MSVRVLGCQKLQMTVWHRMLYCLYPYGNSGRQRVNNGKTCCQLTFQAPSFDVSAFVQQVPHNCNMSLVAGDHQARMSMSVGYLQVCTFLHQVLYTTHIIYTYTRSALDWTGLCSVLHPRQHSIGYMGDSFYRSKDQTNSIKVLQEDLQKTKQTTKTTKYTYAQTIIETQKDIHKISTSPLVYTNMG